MGHLLAPAHVPHHIILIACKVERIVEEAIVGLVFCPSIGMHVSQRQQRLVVQYEHACQGI